MTSIDEAHTPTRIAPVSGGSDSEGVVQTGFMGLALGVAYLVLRRDLWPLVLAHAYMDTILLVQMYASGRP